MRYYITTFPGIEAISKDEIETKRDIHIRKTLMSRNNSLVFFEFKGDTSDLLQIGTSEDLYAELVSVKLLGQKSDLGRIKKAVKSAQGIELALAAHRQLHPKRSSGRTTFRIVAQASGDRSAYRRVDAQKAVERAVNEKFNKRWKLVEDDAQVEFWLHLVNNMAVIGLRLSDKTMRHRAYKLEHLPASLRPTIAYALVWVSGIEDNDVFLDPMCGAATILIERANAGRYKELLGGDIRKEAVSKALKNIGNKYKPISVKVWNACKLPLDDDSVNKVVGNLPFGKQIGTHKENKVLYADFSKELSRVLKFGGKAVLLTSEWRLMQEVLQQNDSLKLVCTYKRVQVLGCNADIFVVERI